MNTNTPPYQRENLDQLFLFFKENMPVAQQSAAQTEALLCRLQEAVYIEITENLLELQGLKARKYREWLERQFDQLPYSDYFLLADIWVVLHTYDLPPHLIAMNENCLREMEKSGLSASAIIGATADKALQLERMQQVLERGCLFEAAGEEILEYAQHQHQVARAVDFLGRREADYISMALLRDYETEFFSRLEKMGALEPHSEILAASYF